ncbi:hypothetical protein IW152_005969 [Coemansia sp. BCRC 34962]|nr:hypothetical protein IW152_005969 [Coemansia sp. BCRC 34962]
MQEIGTSTLQLATATKSSGFTPLAKRSGHSSARVNAAVSSKGLSKERRDEMREYYYDRRIMDDSIRRLTQPVDARLRRLAEDITHLIAGDMEQHLEPRFKGTQSSGDKENDSIASRTRNRGGRTASTLALGPSTKLTSSSGKGLSQRVSKLSILPKEPEQPGISKIQKWARTKFEYDGSEKEMYGSITAFFTYVAHHVKKQLTTTKKVSEAAKGKCRLLLPGPCADYKPGDSDDNTRIDIGLIDSGYDAAVEFCTKPDYYQLRAIVEAKRGKTLKDSLEAFAQLSEYTRQMFAEQYGLRFAFGFAICAGEVRLHHFGNHKIVESAPMDIATREGRRSFIELLVNMSLCEISQLGCDPTIRYLPDLNCWQIDCADDDDNGAGRNAPKQYYFSNIICAADRLLGRHTRCFPATDIRPTRKRGDEESLRATVVIKDAFAFAKPEASEDDRDEVRTLKKIRREFEGDNPDNIMYPKIVVGGRVRFDRGGKFVEDTTSTMYEGVDDELLEKVSGGALFRAHRRIVLESIGKPLRTAETVKEFVAVICDAMECHNAIVERCQILHRDISDNNILVVRENGTVRGLLIDFDCAIDLSKEKKDVRNEMTGTLPFMSLNNITNSSVKRTSLDDCESMLYLLCWHATIGFGSQHERDRAKAGFEEKAIAQWRNGTMVTIAKAKRMHLGSYGNFLDGIVVELDLYEALFANVNLGVEYHGTKEAGGNSSLAALLRRRARPTDAGDSSPNNADPFEMRSREWEHISRDFLDVLVRTKNEMVDWVDTSKQLQ